MTEEDFLKRWSRRKREADVAKPVPPEKETGDTGAIAPEAAAVDTRADAPDAKFDITTLPPIESINAVSDITAFLRAGVPVELTRAALRRVWTADPAIRNFVGLAENAWDFTDPTAMPGFGPLESSDEVRRMIAQVVDQIGEATRTKAEEERPTDAEEPNNSDASETRTASEGQDRTLPGSENAPLRTAEIAAEDLDSQVLLQGNKEDDAAQRDVAEDVKSAKQSSHRIHGTALPR